MKIYRNKQRDKGKPTASETVVVTLAMLCCALAIAFVISVAIAGTP